MGDKKILRVSLIGTIEIDPITPRMGENPATRWGKT